MHLVKGYSVTNGPTVADSRDEERFRYPAVEEIAEVSCGDDEDDRHAAPARRAAGRSMRLRSQEHPNAHSSRAGGPALDRGGDLGFAYES
jgi:hypothetical protein